MDVVANAYLKSEDIGVRAVMDANLIDRIDGEIERVPACIARRSYLFRLHLLSVKESFLHFPKANFKNIVKYYDDDFRCDLWNLPCIGYLNK
jgi:hypothetical protein